VTDLDQLRNNVIDAEIALKDAIADADAALHRAERAREALVEAETALLAGLHAELKRREDRDA
jgi:hypothetical protein